MPEWKEEIQKRLASLKLEPTREAEILEELAQHLEDRYEELRAGGAMPQDAYRAALAELSESELLAQELRRVEGQVTRERVVPGAGRKNLMGDLWQDLRYSVRRLRDNPGFTAVALLTLALGIGANTAIFSLVDAVLLKLLPVRNPEQLVIFAHAGKGAPSRGSNYPLYEFLRDRNQSLAGLFAFWPIDLKFRTESGAQSVAGQFVTDNYFSVLGVNASIGRTLTPGEGADPAIAVISHRFRQRNFGADPGVVGKTLVVNGTPLTIVGVTPPDFMGLEAGSPVDLSVPLTLQHRLLPEFGNRLTESGGFWALHIMGRLKPGVSSNQARADIDALLPQWVNESKLPEGVIRDSLARAELQTGNKGLDALRRRFSEPLLVLTGIVGLVLLIACANIANLLLARSASRRKEMAVRLAIGASRGRLVRQLLTEGMVLAGFGGAAGLLFGWWGSNLLVAFISSGPIPVTLKVDPDPRVLVFTAAVSLLTGIVIGLLPALRNSRIDLTPALKENVAATGFRARWQSGRILVAAQVALSLCLVIAATSFAFSLRNITALNAGFRVENLLLVTFDHLGTGYDRSRVVAFYSDALERVKSLPGVRAAGMSSLMPLSGDNSTRFLDVPGFAGRTLDDHVVHLNHVSAAYFETMGTPLLRGREFTSQDDAGGPKVAVVNETLARFYFAETDPIGRVVRIGRQPAPPIEIVGLVKDSKRGDLREAPARMIYLPSLQYAQPYMTLQIRTDVNPAVITASVRQALLEVNRDIPIREIRTAEAQLESGLVQERLVATLSSFFGGLALVLAALGIYGTLSHLVARRTSEIGIRMALGARRSDVFRLLMGEVAWPVLAGVFVGLIAVRAASSLVTSMLFGLTATDPAVLIFSFAALLATAALAACLPARRAARVDPMVALRYE
jgi:putative ABC transport system permease protein